MLRALSLALVLTGSALLAPPLAAPAFSEEAVVAQEAPPSPPPAARTHQCERNQEGVS
jgi:hypothetical protein